MASRGSHHCRINAGALKRRLCGSRELDFKFQAAAFSATGNGLTELATPLWCSRPTKQAQNARKNAAHDKAAFRARSVRNSRPERGLLWWMLTSTRLQKAGSTSVRLKQWDEERRRCALFWLWGSLRVYPSGGLRLADIGCRRLLGGSNWILRASVTLVVQLVVRKDRPGWMALKLNRGERMKRGRWRAKCCRDAGRVTERFQIIHACAGQMGFYLELQYVVSARRDRVHRKCVSWINGPYLSSFIW